MADGWYGLARRLAFSLDAERVHRLSMGGLSAWSKVCAVDLPSGDVARKPSLARTVCGIQFPNPLGLAAGFDKDAEWYDPYEAELLRFTGFSEAVLDDQFDSSAILFKGLDQMPDLEEDDFADDEELEFRAQQRQVRDGRSKVTGY
jgi:hypothetical protein